MSSVLACAVAATVHPSYLVLGGALTAIFLGQALPAGQGKARVAIAALSAFGVVLPTVAYGLLTFAPTSAEYTHAAQRILIDASGARTN